MGRDRDYVLLKLGGGFSYVALWQMLVFAMLALMVWVNELLDVPARLFDLPARPPDLIRGCVATAGVIVAAIVLVGNTYLQQRRIVSGLLTICSYCKKIRLESRTWQRIEEYIGRRSTINFTHGVCPDCLERVTTEAEREATADAGQR
jgi:hypothetical protein